MVVVKVKDGRGGVNDGPVVRVPRPQPALKMWMRNDEGLRN